MRQVLIDAVLRSRSTVCIRLCHGGPLYSSLLQIHIWIIIWGVPLQEWAQYHRTCNYGIARLWSLRYLHQLKADALQAKGAKAYRDGVCRQRHQTNNRKKKDLQLLYASLRSREPYRPPER